MSSGQMLLCAGQMWKACQSINYSGHQSDTGSLAPIHRLHQGAARTELLANVGSRLFPAAIRNITQVSEGWRSVTEDRHGSLINTHDM